MIKLMKIKIPNAPKQIWQILYSFWGWICC